MNFKLFLTGIGFIIISLLHLMMGENYLEYRRKNSGLKFNEKQLRSVIGILIIGFFVIGIVFVCVSFFYK